MTWLLRNAPSSRGDVYPLSALHHEVNKLFNEVWQTPGALSGVTVKLDIKEDEKAFHVAADLPGLAEREVEITFDDGTLSIRGEKKSERDEKEGAWHIAERSYGTFARQIALPVAIDAAKIEAKFDKGVLRIVLPKLPPEQSKSKRIEIKSS